MKKSIASNIIALSTESTTQLPSFVNGHDSNAVMLTTKDVANLLEINWKRNRNPKDRRWEKYLRQMEKGQFIPTTFHVCVLPNGEEILIDGQHRLKAFIKYAAQHYGKDFTLPATIVRIYIKVRADAGRIYTFYDRKDQSRTAGEMNEASDLASRTGVDKKFHEPGIKAICINDNGLLTGTYDAFTYDEDDVKTDRLAGEVDFFTDIDELFYGEAEKINGVVTKPKGLGFVKKKMKKVLSNSAPLAILMYLWNEAEDHDLVTNFIGELGSSDIIEADSPLGFLFTLLSGEESHGMTYKGWVYVMSIAWNQYHDTFHVKRKTTYRKAITRVQINKTVSAESGFNVGDIRLNGTAAKDGIKNI